MNRVAEALEAAGSLAGAPTGKIYYKFKKLQIYVDALFATSGPGVQDELLLQLGRSPEKL